MSKITEWPYESCTRCGGPMMAEITSTKDGSTFRAWCPKCSRPSTRKVLDKYIHPEKARISAADLTVREGTDVIEKDLVQMLAFELDPPHVVVRYDDLSTALAIIEDGVVLNAFEREVIDRLREALN